MLIMAVGCLTKHL